MAKIDELAQKLFNETQCNVPAFRAVLLSQLKPLLEKSEAAKDYLEWGAMTGSDRDIFARRFKELADEVEAWKETL